MKILILNGNAKPENAKFDSWLDKLAEKLSAGGHKAVMFKLREKKIEFCIGCYACWLKTPGICIHKDDMPDIIRQYVDSHLSGKNLRRNPAFGRIVLFKNTFTDGGFPWPILAQS